MSNEQKPAKRAKKSEAGSDEMVSESSIRSCAKFQLREEVDLKALSLIVDNFPEVFRRLGGKMKLFDPVRKCDVDETDAKVALTTLQNLYKAKKKSQMVEYSYAKYAKFGRRFHKTPSLQEMSKKIRHAIAKDIYYDIDIKNAHPTFCHQYVVDNEMKHPVLEEYIAHRDPFLDDLVEHKLADDRDSAKELFLKLLNGGGTGTTGHLKLDQFYKDHRKFMQHIYSLKQFTKYSDKADEKYKAAKAKHPHTWDNRLGTTLNYWLCDVEDYVLSVIEYKLQELNIEYGTLCFDGLQIYQDSVLCDLPELLLQLEEMIYEYTQIRLKLAVKPMDGGVDLSGLEHKAEINMSDEHCAKLVIEELEGEFLYSKMRSKLYMFNRQSALWQPQEFDCLKMDISRIIKNYILEICRANSGAPVDEQFYFTEYKIESDAKQSSILRQVVPRIKCMDHDDFILRRLDRCDGYFPISNNQVVNLRTGRTEPRQKTHYFTKTTDRVLLDSYDVDYCNDYYTTLISQPDTIKAGEVVRGKRASERYRDSLISAFAYVLSGEANLKLFINLIGSLGDNGKSVFLQLHSDVLGCFAGPGNRRVFEEQINKAVHDSEMFGIIGKSMLTLSETSDKSRYNEEILKSMTGGDATNIRAAASPDSVNVIFSCVPVLVTNSMCQLSDPVFKDRLFCVDFCNQFKRDGAKKNEILSKTDEFFTHLVKYCVEFFKTGSFDICDEIKAFTKSVKEDNFPFRKWSEEQDSFMVSNTGEGVPKEEVLFSYQQYCKFNNFKALGRTLAYERIEAFFNVKPARESGGKRLWIYPGLVRNGDYNNS